MEKLIFRYKLIKMMQTFFHNGFNIGSAHKMILCTCCSTLKESFKYSRVVFSVRTQS